MKILLLGDASNFHNSLAKGLTRLGHDVTVASAGTGWMDTHRNIDISRRENRLGGALLWLKLNTLLARDLRGYDVVQLCGTGFLQLRPHRIKSFFDKLRRTNGSVYLTALGLESEYIRMCLSEDCPLKYSEFLDFGGGDTPYALSHPGETQVWLGDELTDLTRHIYDNVDGIATALYEYQVAVERYAPLKRQVYTGIPIDMDDVDYHRLALDGPLRIMLACHKGREAEKGADRLLPVLQRLAADHPGKIRFDFVQNRPYGEFCRILEDAHVVVDQLYSYTPATTALLAMAAGKIVVSGAEEQFYRFIGEDSLRPIINVDPYHPEAVADTLLALADDHAKAAALSRDSHAFTLKHNDASLVAKRFESLWSQA